MTLLGLVSAITGFVKVRFLEEKEVIDTAIFRLHSRATCAMLFLACALCTATTLLGDPIACLNDFKKGDFNKPLNTYCWISSTFSLPKHLHKPAGQVIYAGIGPHSPGEDEQTFHTYYQWVPFALLFQGILFYLPHWLWKSMEQKRIEVISKGLRGVLVDPNRSHDSVERLADYLVQTVNSNTHYGVGYMLCELLNLVNVIGNIFLIDKFLGGVFLSYGTEVISFANMEQFNRTDPMIRIFPRITKCAFHSYGSSGSIQTHDLMCVMAINVINEKIYIFLWFWLFALCGLTVLGVLHSLALVVSRDWRAVVLRKRFLSRPEAEFLAHTLPLGDFMLLNFLSYNVDSSLFDLLLQHVHARVKFSNFKGLSKHLPY
ncbi:innexin inx3-like [Bacillus rossius redtenbacheri]|uniref:innexin inx3-like n=1 Tax=Bacillus rossius redtenbacheri TaxID=93214 RepID=UPI002FDEAC99